MKNLSQLFQLTGFKFTISLQSLSIMKETTESNTKCTNLVAQTVQSSWESEHTIRTDVSVSLHTLEETHSTLFDIKD